MTDPKRLLDDPSIAASLRADLAQAKAAGIIGFDATAGAASLSAAIAAEAGAAAAVAGTGISKGLLLGVVGVISAGVIAWALQSRPPEPTAVLTTTPHVDAESLDPSGRAKPIEPTPPEPAAPAAVEPEPTLEEPEPEPEPEPTPQTKPAEGRPLPSSGTKKPHPSKRAGTADDYLREARLIAQARRVLKSDPKRALALLDEAKKSFPKGMLREEREALTILALHQHGRTDQAKSRAERFLKVHSESPHAEAVRQVLH